MEDNLSAAAGYCDAGHQCALPSCDFRGQQLLEFRKNGRQEDHQEWEEEEVHEECDLMAQLSR